MLLSVSRAIFIVAPPPSLPPSPTSFLGGPAVSLAARPSSRLDPGGPGLREQGAPLPLPLRRGAGSAQAFPRGLLLGGLLHAWGAGSDRGDCGACQDRPIGGGVALSRAGEVSKQVRRRISHKSFLVLSLFLLSLFNFFHVLKKAFHLLHGPLRYRSYLLILLFSSVG